MKVIKQQEFIKDYNSTEGNNETYSIKGYGRNAETMSIKLAEKSDPLLEKCAKILE